MTPHQLAVVIELRAKGMSYAGIARRVGAGKTSVDRALRRYRYEVTGGEPKVQPGKRCGRCFLLEPHVCLPAIAAGSPR